MKNCKGRGPERLGFPLMVFLLYAAILASPAAHVGMAIAVTPHTKVETGPIETGRLQAAENVAVDPLNATYHLQGEIISLKNGRSEIASSPDSATKITTDILGDPVIGDLDADGDEDAALFLAHDPGGSGTFYYVAAALNENGRYRGTNAVLLGDRVIPEDLAIRDGFVEVRYSDRPAGEPMSTRPTVKKQSYATLDDGILHSLKPLGPGEQLVQGWVTIGHEVRTLRPCSMEQALWLSGASPALREIMARYQAALPGARPYTPLFVVLAGEMASSTQHGLGANYEASFVASQLVSVGSKGNCRSDWILVDSPVPGETVASPLTVRGRARGSWFFEGDFSLRLEDGDGNVISQGYATAKGPWMTREFVDFEGTLKFKKPLQPQSGILILQKDNPSDRRELDDAIRVFVFLE